MTSYHHENFEDSIFYDDGPTTLMERLGYVKQLFLSKTKLEFRLLWNKIFQKEDEELGWLLNPHKQKNGCANATMMASFNKNDQSDLNYDQYGYENVASVLGRERVTIHNRGVAKSDSRRRRKREDTRTISDKALDYARYMGLGVYITSSAFPSPFAPINDCTLYGEQNYNYQQSSFAMSKLW